MAHKKAGGSSRNGRDSNGQRRGTKAYGSQRVHAGSIIVRQCGTKILPGRNVGLAKDDSLFAKATGIVEFRRHGKDKKMVHIVPAEAAAGGN